MQNKPVKGASCLIDTDIAIDFLRGRDYARKLLQKWANDGLLAVSTLTHLEIYQGMKPGEEEKTNAFLDGIVSINVDVPIARRAGKILADLRGRGITAGIGDSIIAATALQLDAPLLTNNLEHYQYPGLTVVQGVSSSAIGTSIGVLKGNTSLVKELIKSRRRDAQRGK